MQVLSLLERVAAPHQSTITVVTAGPGGGSIDGKEVAPEGILGLTVGTAMGGQ
jgi:hypothetical protein